MKTDQRTTAAPIPRQRHSGRRFLTQTSVTLLTLLTITALATLPWTLSWMNVQQLDHAVRHAPSATPILSIEKLTTPTTPTATVINTPTQAHSAIVRSLHGASSWMGHDDLGRSLLFRLLPGFLISLGIGIAAAAIAIVVGVLFGSIAALAGGRIDAAMMRIVDVLFSLPYVLTVILLKVALTRPLTALFGGESAIANLVILLVAISGVSWLTMARVIRGQVLSLREQPFIEASRAAGAGWTHILLKHITPNLMGPITVYAALVVPQAIMQEAFLSFLGIGIQPPTPSLGRLAADGVEAVNTFVSYWWLIVFPCAALVLTLVALNFIGDALRNALDPKSAT